MKKMMYEHEALDEPIEVMGEYVVCPECRGEGHHVRRDIDDSALVDSMKADGDEEGIEMYYRGAYDVVCIECKGQRVVIEPVLPDWASKRIHEWYECNEETRATYEAERRMGC